MIILNLPPKKHTHTSAVEKEHQGMQLWVHALLGTMEAQDLVCLTTVGEAAAPMPGC